MKLLKVVHIFIILLQMMDLFCEASRPVSVPSPQHSVFIGKDNHPKTLSPEEDKESMVMVVREEGDEKGKEEKYEEMKKMIGSRPPSCTNKCYGCMPCEAIQVPAAATSTSTSTGTSTGGGGGGGMQYANYLPEGWKCKCGSTFYTP